MTWRNALALSVLLLVTTNASGKKLVLDADNPEHWDEVRIGEMFSTGVVADMKRMVHVPEPFYWQRSGTYRRIGWRKDLKQIERKNKPKIRYGYFLCRTTSSIVYNSDQRIFEKTVDDELMSAQEYLESLDATDLTLTPVVIDDHDVLIAEGMIGADQLRLVLIAENIASSTLQITFVCNEDACREPSALVWEKFRETLLGTE